MFLDPLLRDESKRTRFGIKLGQSFYPMNAARYIASEDSTSSGGGDRTGTGSSSGGGGFKWGEWEEFYLEKKLDGERMLVHKLGNAGGGGAGGSRGAGAGSANTNIRVWSRNQTDYTREYGDIMQVGGAAVRSHSLRLHLQLFFWHVVWKVASFDTFDGTTRRSHTSSPSSLFAFCV